MREHSATETQRNEASKAVTKPPTLSAASRGVYRFFLRDFRSVEELHVGKQKECSAWLLKRWLRSLSLALARTVNRYRFPMLKASSQQNNVGKGSRQLRSVTSGKGLAPRIHDSNGSIFY